jgi:hypothetical protein
MKQLRAHGTNHLFAVETMVYLGRNQVPYFILSQKNTFSKKFGQSPAISYVGYACLLQESFVIVHFLYAKFTEHNNKLILGLPVMNQDDAAAQAISEIFTDFFQGEEEYNGCSGVYILFDCFFTLT